MMHHWYNSFDSDDRFQEPAMHPYASHIIGQMKMKELQEEAGRYRLADRLRSEQPRRVRTAAGKWLIALGERMLPDPAYRALEVHH